MMSQIRKPGKTGISTVALLWSIFLVIACGLGYPVLNRFDPRQTPGLSDVKTYAAMVTGTVSPDAGHVRFRVLVPELAKPFYFLARGFVARAEFASWDPVMFGLLMADSMFVAGTAVLIVVLGIRQLGNPAAGLVAALLYLVNFAVPNLRLVGLVDAAEGFFLLALIWSLTESALWAVPVIAVLGTLAKESFVPFSVVLTFAWWLVMGSERDSLRKRSYLLPDAVWIVGGWMLSVATMIGLQWDITGAFVNPLKFGLELHLGHDYLGHFAASLHDRNLWYIFLWLLPTAIPNLKSLPKTWLMPMGTACIMAFVLDAYYGGAPGTVGRALFSVAGPMLSLSSALFLLRLVVADSERAKA